jgi:hypothetical protein
MPLGSGYSAEEQITGEAEHGGIQIVVYPMKRKVFDKLKSIVEMGKKKGDNPLPENESVEPGKIVKLRKGLKEGQVREGVF